jgi:hypothetical protein
MAITMAMLSIMAVLIILAMIIQFVPSVNRPASMFQSVFVSHTDKFNYSNHQKGSSKAQITAQPSMLALLSMYRSVPSRIRRLQNYELLRKLPELAKLGYPLLVGTSREGFLGATLAQNGRPPQR